MKHASLAWRVRALVIGTALAVVGVVSLVAYRQSASAHRGQLDRLLEVMAGGIGTAAEAYAHDPARVAEATAALAVSPWRGPRAEYRVWRDGETHDLASSGKPSKGWGLEGLAPPALGEATFYDIAERRKRWRGIWLRRSAQDAVLNVVLLHPANWEQRRLDALLWVLVGTGGITALVAAVLSTPLVRLTLRPLDELVRALPFLGPGRDRPPALGSTERPAELEPLARGIDELVTRFDAELVRRRALAGETAHQLRTPLALARSTLELAQSANDDAEAKRGVAEALEDLARMQRSIEQIVALARAEAGPSRETTVELRLDALLEEMAAAYRAKASERGCQVACESLAPVEVAGDEALLRMLFGSLLENAIQYGPRGGTIRVGLELGSGGRATATVQDDGGSLPLEAIDRLFERFYRGENASAMHPSGSGLGLAIAREIARGHGGEVWVTSSPGSRTTLHVQLPARAVAS